MYYRELTPDNFLPLHADKLITYCTEAWLGIRAPNIHTSNKWKSIILGALALNIPLQTRHMISSREMFGGICVISGKSTISFTNPHTPPLAENLNIRHCDQEWLEKLTTKLISDAD